jgi:hypothetical protein
VREVQSVAAIEDREFPEEGERTRAARMALLEEIEASLS